jgi:hypothetical protein
MEPRSRFPRTPHVVNGPLSGKAVTRDDLIITPEEAQLFVDAAAHGEPVPTRYVVVVEEKLDGANLGFSLAPDGGTLVAQNRSHFVNSATATQWAGLSRFLEISGPEIVQLFYALSDEPAAALATSSAAAPASTSGRGPVMGPGGLGQPSVARTGAEATPSENPALDWILYGEWLAYQHSVFYDALPSPFVVFDLYHVPTHRFLAADARNLLVEKHCPSLVLARRVYSGPLVVSKGASGRKHKASARQQQQPLPTSGSDVGPVSSWDELHALWHHQPSGFFGSLAPRGRDGETATGQAGPPRYMEGVVIRLDDEERGTQLMRCKAVHDEFIAAIDDHWRSKAAVKNIVCNA